jgi:uncharacterized protein YoxC
MVMKMGVRPAFVLLVAVACHAKLEEKSKVTPIQKVLELMAEMKAKGIKEKNAEEVRFSAFAQWCTDTKRTKTDEIEAADQKIEELKAGIEKAAVLIKKLTDRILELDEDVGRWKKDEKSATTVRDKEKADYLATLTDYTQSIDALKGAIAVLKKQDFDRKQASAALIQVSSLKLVPVASKKALTNFLQQDPELVDWSAPEANAYEFQSGGVIEMLEKLDVEFSTKKTDLEKEELNNENNFQQIMQWLADSIENADFEIEKKTKFRAETEEKKAELEGDLASTTADRDEDQKYLDETVALCDQKTKDFESRQELRAGEIEAISKAIEIISSKTVAGAGEEYLPTLLQVNGKKAQALAQLRSSNMSPSQEKVAIFLTAQAHKIGSRLLSTMALSAEANPFTKVKKMIKDLISKLMEEATAEAEHKGWCDTELTTNKQTRDKKTAEIHELENTIDDLTATIAELTQDIADLTEAVSELDKEVAKQTEERTESKASNEETIKSAKEAQIAVQEAMAILKDFYAKSADATAFSQQPAADAPETFEKPYKGLLPEGGSVIDFLEVILSDFSKLQAETEASEAEEADEYKTFMFESKKDKAMKENDIKHKSETKVRKESALKQADEDLKVTKEQLDKALEYYEKLKPTCVESGITYAERVKRREEEIVSLQEALKILKGTDLPTMD